MFTDLIGYFAGFVSGTLFSAASHQDLEIKERPRCRHGDVVADSCICGRIRDLCLAAGIDASRSDERNLHDSGVDGNRVENQIRLFSGAGRRFNSRRFD